MAKKTTKTGKALERQVADAYRAMGARKVEHDVELAGHQIDVYVEMETADRALHRIAVEAKDYTKPVGIKIVADFAAVVNGLRTLKLVDEGVIVSAAGFSRPARNAAKEHGLRLLEPSDLAAMAALPDLARMRADYLASLRQRFEYLDLGGIAPRVQNRTVKLRMDDVFIPVQARPELESRDEWLDWMDGMPGDEAEAEMTLRMLARSEQVGEAGSVEIPDLLSHPRVVILGDPGCGKSTLLRHVAYGVACGNPEVSEVVLVRLPIFVRIVQFSQAQAQDSTLTLDTYVRQVCEPRWAPLFQHALDSGEALMLLDGLDEVVDAHQRREVAEAIQRLVADYSDNAFIVTSRIVGYQAARLSGDFAHYTIQPLHPERIAEFVEKWYASIEREAGEAELSEEARGRAEELSRTIQERPGIRRLAENPLLLTIIALVNWRGRKLPNRRVELYAHAAETLIESWPYRRQGVELDTERVIRLLSPVAYRIFATRSSGDIAEDDLLPILADAICRVDGVDERTAKEYTREFLEQISERSGIFRERGYDERGRRVFGFLHLTFAEYFTARYLAGLWEGMENADARRAFLRKYAHVPRWHEVMLLTAGDIGMRDNDNAERATLLLRDILTMGSDYEQHLYRDLLLVGECLADDLRVQPQAADYSIEKLLDLVPKPGVSGAVQRVFCTMKETIHNHRVLKGLLRQLESEDKDLQVEAAEILGVGEFDALQAIETLSLLLENSSKDVGARAAEALGRIGDLQAVEPLIACLKDRNWMVRGESARALGKLGSPQAKDALQACLQDRNRWVRIIATEALWQIESLQVSPSERMKTQEEITQVRVKKALEGFGDVRDVDSLLTALEDDRANTRWYAAWSLGELGDPRAVESLIARLDKDQSSWVRWSLAEALGNLGDVRAVEPLIAHLSDASQKVRSNAASALGKLGDTQAVEPLLVLLNDRDDITRRLAAKALGRLGDMRAINPLFAQLEDESKWVRSYAYQALITILERNAPQPEIEKVTCEPQAVSGPWDT